MIPSDSKDDLLGWQSHIGLHRSEIYRLFHDILFCGYAVMGTAIVELLWRGKSFFILFLLQAGFAFLDASPSCSKMLCFTQLNENF